MNMIQNARIALKLKVQCQLATPLLLRSGNTGDITDSAIERTPENQLHINGYVWASLLRRSLARINGCEDLVTQIGKNQGEYGVSPLWCDTTITTLPATAVNAGIAIDRETGAATVGALFTDELVIAGLPIEFKITVFATTNDEINRWQKALVAALQIVNEGIENIGGGWTYGYGRLKIESIKSSQLDLTKQNQRLLLWQRDEQNSTELKFIAGMPENATPVSTITVTAKVADGQLMAIKSTIFPLDAKHLGKLPDTFVFRRNRLDDGKLLSEPVLPGKALRQALFSAPLERKLRSCGENICHPSSNKACGCHRCKWFGSTSAAGVISVSDAVVTNPAYEVINRIQLCEHSMQNMNLFAGEYLTRGNCQFKIIIDEARLEDTVGLLEEIELLLDEMKGINAPAGWHRIGGTTSCTGQIQVVDYTISRSMQQ